MHSVVHEHAVGDLDDAQRRLVGGARLGRDGRRDGKKPKPSVPSE